MPDGNKCPQCGTPLPTGALAGLCPACLLKQGAEGDTITDAKQPPFNPPAIPELTPVFPQLEILELIGKGGMGAVYKARQKQLDRIVALKILPPGIGHDAAFAERFTREAQALAKLNHPGIVTLYEFGETGGQFYFLMEFVDGVNLRQLLAGSRVSPREALAIVPQICDALQFAHDQGIVHRDIKPENILLDRRGRVKVADFGLAKIVESGRADLPVSPNVGAAQQHGPTGVMGTPNYMAPEQKEHPDIVDNRADIYALGVVFYQMLTGELPGKKIEPPSSKVQIDVRLDEIVLRALEKKPELRYQHVSEVKTGVETIVATTPGSSRHEEAQTESERRKAGGSLVTPAATSEGARFSRTAIVGACWALLFFLPVMVMPALALWGKHNEPATRMLILMPLLLLGLPGIFGTTILGWIAVSQIRRSAGKVYGMWLAVFDGLLFPLLALDWVIALLWLLLAKLFARQVLGLQDSLFLDLWDLTIWVSLALASVALVNWLFIRRVWRAVNKTKDTNMKKYTIATITALCLAALFLVACYYWPVKSDYIGQAYFPKGDSIQITSVERTKNKMTVKGHYNLVSADSAKLALYITTQSTNAVPTDSKQEMQISKGQGGFELTDPNLVPGLPHISMYADGKSFAALFFGTKAEAQEESKASWITNTPASYEAWSPALTPGEKSDLQKILDDAKTLMEQHKYEDVLLRHIWYHNHEPEFGDSYQNVVRITSAISDWVELGRRYPKAKEALIEIRDQDTRALEEGRGYAELFTEVQAINRALQDEDATYVLFKTIREKDPQLASQCYLWIESLLVAKGEYQWCYDHMGDPQSKFESIKREYEMETANQKRMTEIQQRTKQTIAEMNQNNGFTNAPAYSPPDTSAMMQKSAEDRFVGSVRQLLEILVATGHQVDAERIRFQAASVLGDSRLMSAVSDAEQKLKK